MIHQELNFYSAKNIDHPKDQYQRLRMSKVKNLTSAKAGRNDSNSASETYLVAIATASTFSIRQ